MAYIGRGTDKLSNIEKLDVITFDGSSSYTLQKNSVNFTPSSANSLQVSIDGVVQAGNFTVSGSTIDFGVAIPSTSTNDFIFHYGTGLITTPADGTVTTGKLADSSVTTAKLVDASVTSAKLSGVTEGITEADQWRTTTDNTYNAGDIISLNWERTDGAPWNDDYIGTGLTEASGVFTIPTTGMYLINYNFRGSHPSTGFSYMDISLQYDNGSGYVGCTAIATENYNNGLGAPQNLSSAFMINAADSNRKFRFSIDMDNNGYNIEGNTTRNETGFQIIRIGDAV
jgi:hypothetical protein